MSVSYLSGGTWYVLRENGTGAIKGSDAAYGVGTLSYLTGSVALTLGALPDVGSAIILQFYTSAVVGTVPNADLVNGAKLYTPLNTSNFDGILSDHDNNLQAAIETNFWKAIAWFPQVKIHTLMPGDVRQYDLSGLAFWNVNTPEEFAKAEEIAQTNP